MTAEKQSPDEKKQSPRGPVTEELVKALSEKVYALLLQDLRLANERRGRPAQTLTRPHGR